MHKGVIQGFGAMTFEGGRKCVGEWIGGRLVRDSKAPTPVDVIPFVNLNRNDSPADSNVRTRTRSSVVTTEPSQAHPGAVSSRVQIPKAKELPVTAASSSSSSSKAPPAEITARTRTRSSVVTTGPSGAGVGVGTNEAPDTEADKFILLLEDITFP